MDGLGALHEPRMGEVAHRPWTAWVRYMNPGRVRWRAVQAFDTTSRHREAQGWARAVDGQHALSKQAAQNPFPFLAERFTHVLQRGDEPLH